MTDIRRKRRIAPSPRLGRFRWKWATVPLLLALYCASESPLTINCYGGYSFTQQGSRSFADARKVEDDEKSKQRSLRINSSNRAQNPTANQKTMTLNQILIKAGRKGLGGGIPGALAGIVQVVTLMWLRTIINYQCRYGTTFRQALVTLLREGGVGRLYRGVAFALIQAPLARFGSTAANDGVEAFVSNFEPTRNWGPGRTTIVASIVVGGWRMLIMPIDTMKTVLQVDSAEGFRNLMRRLKSGKLNVLYQGAFANAIAAIVGHYPWFYIYNWLANSEQVRFLLPSSLLRNAGIGLVASVVSDTVVNCIRVIKTNKQSLGSKHSISYSETIRMVLAADGWKGLFGRGLRTRIFANALQSVVFTVLWRALTERFRRTPVDAEE